MSVGPTHDEPLPPGALVGRHRIERLLRRRVAGTDYLATAPYPGAPAERVLLTVVDRAASITPAFGNWFRDAIQKASAMAHPGIARITGHGIADGCAWVAVAPVPASDAALLIRRHPDGIGIDLAVRIVTVVGEALDAAHRRRLVHGNVSPADILLNGSADPTVAGASVPGAVTLTGFGLTAPIAGDEMPHPAADVASLGRTLVEMLTGAGSEASGPNVTGTSSVARHRVSGAVSPAFYAVLARALDADSEHRYRTCAEFVRAAELALHLTHSDGEPPTEAIPASHPESEYEFAATDSDTTEVVDAGPAAGVPRVFQPAGHPDRPTEVVTDRPRGAGPVNRPSTPPPMAPPPTASPSMRRRRLIAPFFVATAIVAVVVGTVMLLGARTTPPPWPAGVAPIAAAFPQLLPETPEESGWGDADCEPVVRDGIAGISCTDAANVGFVVWHTPTSPSRAAVTTGLKGYPGDEISWRDGPASASRDSVVDGWVVTNFSGPPHAQYTLVTTWPGHTGRDILDDWWRTAPLG